MGKPASLARSLTFFFFCGQALKIADVIHVCVSYVLSCIPLLTLGYNVECFPRIIRESEQFFKVFTDNYWADYTVIIRILTTHSIGTDIQIDWYMNTSLVVLHDDRPMIFITC